MASVKIVLKIILELLIESTYITEGSPKKKKKGTRQKEVKLIIWREHDFFSGHTQEN